MLHSLPTKQEVVELPRPLRGCQGRWVEGPTRILSKEDLLVMSYSRSKAAGEREITWGTRGRRVDVPSGLGKELECMRD